MLALGPCAKSGTVLGLPLCHRSDQIQISMQLWSQCVGLDQAHQVWDCAPDQTPCTGASHRATLPTSLIQHTVEERSSSQVRTFGGVGDRTINCHGFQSHGNEHCKDPPTCTKFLTHTIHFSLHIMHTSIFPSWIWGGNYGICVRKYSNNSFISYITKKDIKIKDIQITFLGYSLAYTQQCLQMTHNSEGLQMFWRL